MEAEDQVIRYAEADGRSIAWSAVGSGPPLVIGGWWSSHLDLDWRNPGFRRFVGSLAAHRTVIRYDRPGSGMSDRGGLPADSLEQELVTLESLVDAAVGPDRRIAIFGASSGGGVASLFAARHPQRVDHLVLYGSYARGADLAPPAARETLLGVVEQHWGLGSRVLADLFLPDATAREREEFVEFQRRSASPDVALASLRAVYAFDSTAHLGDVLAPTLVLHRREDRAIPFALGKDVASRIRSARFVALEGDDHFPWRGDVEAVLRETLGFLGVRVPAVAPTGTGMTQPVEPARLTEREREVLRLVARGETDAEIAAHLALSPHTVHRHIANIRTKLGAPSRAAAATLALRNRLI